jgi:tetratricopeptide (TPR) repeat protein
MHFSAAPEMNPQAAYAANLAKASANSCNWPAALEAAVRCLAMDEGHAEALFRRAQALEMLGRLEEAAGAYRAGLARLPGSKRLEEGLRGAEAQLVRQSACAMGHTTEVKFPIQGGQVSGSMWQ